MQLTLEDLRNAVAGKAAAFRCITDYQPAGGPGDKVFPPTYEGGKYATENRVDPQTGELVPCVLLDSVQSQANRMELALLEAHREGRVQLPLLIARFDQQPLLKKFTVTSLEAPHRAADALFRDSLLDGVIFRKSDKGRILDTADIRNATGLFGLCPTALVFGLWDSTGPRGGLGAKFQRAMVSEIIGYRAEPGVTTSGKVDNINILIEAGTLYRRALDSDDAPHWTLDEAKSDGKKPLGKDGKPSRANLGGVTPDFSYAKDHNGNILREDDGQPRIKGGFTISKARQTTVLSLSALRRLRFPLEGNAESNPQVDVTARTALAALGLAAATLARGDGDLRSRCQLFPEQEPAWELLDRPGGEPPRYTLTDDQALELLNEAVEAAKAAGLPWEGEIELTPADELVELVRRSQEIASATGTEEA